VTIPTSSLTSFGPARRGAFFVRAEHAGQIRSGRAPSEHVALPPRGLTPPIRNEAAHAIPEREPNQQSNRENDHKVRRHDGLKRLIARPVPNVALDAALSMRLRGTSVSFFSWRFQVAPAPLTSGSLLAETSHVAFDAQRLKRCRCLL
jgi:hypothetical protein